MRTTISRIISKTLNCMTRSTRSDNLNSSCFSNSCWKQFHPIFLKFTKEKTRAWVPGRISDPITKLKTRFFKSWNAAFGLFWISITLRFTLNQTHVYFAFSTKSKTHHFVKLEVEQKQPTHLFERLTLFF
jgi:hypothetical protein